MHTTTNTMRYNTNNPRGKMIFDQLLNRSKQNLYDNTYLRILESYERLYPKSDRQHIFHAKYEIHHKNYKAALEHSLKAYRMRKANIEIWQLLAICYVNLDQPLQAAFFQGLSKVHYSKPLTINIPGEQLDIFMHTLSQAFGIGHYAPFVPRKAFWGENGLYIGSGVLAGEYLHSIPFTTDAEKSQYIYWVGAYAEQENLNSKGLLLESYKNEKNFCDNCGGDFVFDIIKSKTIQDKVTISPDTDTIIPIAATETSQNIEIASGELKESYSINLGKWAYSFFRLTKPTSLTSKNTFIIGEPIPLIHSQKRKKLVLNILLDALSWGAEKSCNFRHVPNIINFFKKGIIFNNHFSIAEYTYPSFAAIETGMHLHKSQNFNELVRTELDPKYKTLSEKMKELGYYCVNVMGGGDAIYNGSTRGFDRLITASYNLHTYEAVERLIQQLEAFGECDQYLMIHTMDTHPWSALNQQVPVITQTKLNLIDRLIGATSKETSVRLPHTRLYSHANITGIKNADRNLGILFNYLENHYNDDDYIITLYSDHGTTVYDDFSYTFSDKQCGAALMTRGANVPSLGFVEELVSGLDIYPMMAHLAGFDVGDWVDGNLPAVFGGKEREYVISNSIFPGQSYSICIRTQKYEFHLKSCTPVEFDGTVDLSNAYTSILLRSDPHQEVFDSNLQKYFFDIVQEHTKSFNNEGHVFPSIRKY